jgi:hypothetical protein
VIDESKAVKDTAIDVRVFAEGDEPALLELHNRAFAGHPARSRAHWDWKFRGNGNGPVHAAVAMRGTERCLAVYAVVPHRCVLRGEEGVAGLQTDVAIDAELRRGLGGSRILVELGRRYLATFKTPSLKLEWGFPEPGLHEVSLAHLRVGVLRDVVFLVRDAEAALPEPAARLDVHCVSRFGADADELWRRAALDFGAALVRDARYLNWRYADHPDIRYTLLEARSGGALRGLAVLRDGGVDPRTVSLVDWLVPAADREAERALVAAALEETRARAMPCCVAWFPLALPLGQRFQRDHGFYAKSSPFQECYRAWTRGLGRRWLDANWYQTMGDIDFV